jgi:hypothetical protein
MLIEYNMNMLPRLGVTNKTGVELDDWIYCTLYIHTVQDYGQYSAIAILHTLQFTVAHALGFSVFTSRILATDLSQYHCNFKSHMKSSIHCLIPFIALILRLPIPKTRLSLIPLLPSSHPGRLVSRSSTIHFRWLFSTTPVLGRVWVLSLMLRPTVSRQVCLGIKHPSEAYDQIFILIWQLRVCWCGATSLTRGRVCRLQLLLALANTAILGSESLGTRDHILLSQIRDFPFRRLLRLAGSRWRYSSPPPHSLPTVPLYNPSARTPRKTPLYC